MPLAMCLEVRATLTGLRDDESRNASSTSESAAMTVIPDTSNSVPELCADTSDDDE